MQAESYEEHVGSPVHSPVLTRSASGTSVFSAMSVQSAMSSDPSAQGGASVPHNRLRCSRPTESRRPRAFRASRKPSHNLTVQIPHSHSMGMLPDEDAQANFPPDIISPWSQDSTYSPLRSSTPTSELTGVVNAERQRQRYQMHAVLGGSIFGQVVAATDLQTGTPVAIKLSNLIKVRQLYQQMSQPSDVLENPLHEAQLMRILSGQESGRHPYVLNLINEFCTENGNLHWMVLEYAPNKDLFEMVLQAKHFPDNMARHYFLQVLSGVHFIHQHGICHLDLSLENLLLDDKWNVKICDFGVARPLPRDGSPFPPMRIHSKVRYMAPELLSVSQFFDGRQVDIFSLGVILYCLLVGHPPFESAAESDQAYQLIASGQLRKLLQMVGLSDRCSDSAADLISRMVCPADRRITMRDILAHPWLQIHQAPPVALLPPTIMPVPIAVPAPPAMPIPLPLPQQVIIQPAPQPQPAVLSIVNPNAQTKPGSA